MSNIREALTYVGLWKHVSTLSFGLIVLGSGFLITLFFMSPAALGGLTIYGLLLGVGVSVALGGVLLWRHMFRQQEKDIREDWAENARIEANIRRLKKQIARDSADIERMNAETARMNAETEIKHRFLDQREKELMIDRRRHLALEATIEREKIKLDIRYAQLRAQYGSKEQIPDTEHEISCELLFGAINEEDGPFFAASLRNPFAFTTEPKPLKKAENKLQALFDQKVDEEVLTATEIEEVSCPILREVMQDPVKGEDGHTYERYSLQEAYYRLPGTYPLTRQEMSAHPDQLPRDQAMYDKIQALVARCQKVNVMPMQKSAEESYEGVGRSVAFR